MDNSQFSHGLGTVDLLKLSLRVFKTKPLRTSLTILGMSFGIGTVLFLVSLGYGLQYVLIGKLVATEDSLITLEAYYPSETDLNIAQDDLKMISALPETDEISPVSEFTGEIYYENIAGLIVTKIIKPNYFRLSGQLPDIGSKFNENEAAVVISNSAVKLTDAHLDKFFTFKIFFQNEGNLEVEEAKTTEPLKLTGIIT